MKLFYQYLTYILIYMYISIITISQLSFLEHKKQRDIIMERLKYFSNALLLIIRNGRISFFNIQQRRIARAVSPSFSSCFSIPLQHPFVSAPLSLSYILYIHLLEQAALFNPRHVRPVISLGGCEAALYCRSKNS